MSVFDLEEVPQLELHALELKAKKTEDEQLLAAVQAELARRDEHQIKMF